MSALAEEQGRETTSVETRAPGTFDRTCAICGVPFRARSRTDVVKTCLTHRWLRHSAIVDPLASVASDAASAGLVAAHPDGMTLDEIGIAIGVSRERVRQIEAIAFRKLHAAMTLQGVSIDDVRAMLASKLRCDLPSGIYDHSNENQRERQAAKATAHATQIAAALDPCEWVRERLHLLDVLDEVIAVGELAVHAANIADGQR